MKTEHFSLVFLLLFALTACQTAVSSPTTTSIPTATPPPTATTTTNDPSALDISITAVSTHDVTRNLPAYLTYTTTGDDITSIALVARGQDSQLLTHQFIPLADEDNVIFWHGTASYIHDGLGDGTFVLTQRDADGRFVAPGQYQRAGESHSVMAELYFDGENGRLLQATQFPTTGNRAPINQPITAGDSFTFDWLHESGDAPVLTINPTGLLFLEERGLENGRYQLGLIAENDAGKMVETFSSISVHHVPISRTHPTHIDPYHAVAFAYPTDWTVPTSGSLIQTGNISNTVTAAISFHSPLPSGGNALSLKQDALNRFGGVHLLYEQDIVLGERRGLRTVYGYEDGAGVMHTGVLLTAVNDNIGIIIDIDGIAADEAETITAAAILQESWHFLPTRIGDQKNGR